MALRKVTASTDSSVFSPSFPSKFCCSCRSLFVDFVAGREFICSLEARQITEVMARTTFVAVLVAILLMTTRAFDLDPEVTKKSTSDSMNCDGTLRSLLSCLPAVEGDDPEPPSKECCTAVVHVNLDCLCNAIGQGDAGSYPGMDVNAALQLPRECGRIVPKGFKCAGYLIPTYP